MPQTKHHKPLIDTLAQNLRNSWVDDVPTNGQPAENQQKLEELLSQSHQQMSYQAKRKLRHAEDAEDAVQMAAHNIVRNFQKYDASRSFSSWLGRVTSNAIIDQIRRQNRHQQRSVNETEYQQTGETNFLNNFVSDNTKTPVENVLDIEKTQQAQNLIQGLYATKPKLAMVVDDWMQGFKYREIAERRNIPDGTVKSRVNMAIKLLSQQLSEEKDSDSQNDRQKDSSFSAREGISSKRMASSTARAR